jgi:hypothetical protein
MRVSMQPVSISVTLSAQVSFAMLGNAPLSHVGETSVAVPQHVVTLLCRLYQCSGDPSRYMGLLSFRPFRLSEAFVS